MNTKQETDHQETENDTLHYVYDLFGLEPERLNDPGRLRELIQIVLVEGGFTKMQETELHRVEQSDRGYSGFVLIRGGHLCFHTYPEQHQMAIDLFYGGTDNGDAQAAIDEMLSVLHPEEVRALKLPRNKRKMDLK